MRRGGEIKEEREKTISLMEKALCPPGDGERQYKGLYKDNILEAS